MSPVTKICGITQTEDALLSAELGARYLGYIFYPPSKRFISPGRVAGIVRSVREAFPALRHVGVFVNEPASKVLKIREEAGLDFAQLHGEESADYCQELALAGVNCIKTIGIGEQGCRSDYTDYATDFFLCDTYDAKLKGGTGKPFDLDRIPAGIPLGKTFIAGGINAENVQSLIGSLNCYGVDVSSGVESAPGIKSAEKLIELFRAINLSTRSTTVA